MQCQPKSAPAAEMWPLHLYYLSLLAAAKLRCSPPAMYAYLHLYEPHIIHGRALRILHFNGAPLLALEVFPDCH